MYIARSSSKPATMAFLLACLAASGAAHGAAPSYIPIQGVMYDDAGAPIDAEVTATFSIY
ncbi:MAG: hypothetical protein JRG91_11685, partial [Deltaproteobacteria bacterium]|nr:hypothetical protein [Deltaproteobacteria bacterium]